jgi:hypothetical protein
MSPYHLLLRGSLSLALSSVCFAQTPIKSVDKSGNVTYSDKPAEDAVSAKKVPIDPAPAPEQIKAAKERVEKIQEQADAAEKSRKEAEAKRLAEQEAARKREEAKPEVIVIKEGHSGYPVYNNPPLITPPPIQKPPQQRPPGNKPDHPAYKPPTATPPTILPIPKAGR